MTAFQLKAFSFVIGFAAILSTMAPGCSSKPQVTETTITQTNPKTGTTVTKTTGIEEKGDNQTTWTSTTIKK